MLFLSILFLQLSPVEKFDQIFKPPEAFVEEINLYAAGKIAEAAPLLITFSMAGFAIKSFIGGK